MEKIRASIIVYDKKSTESMLQRLSLLESRVVGLEKEVETLKGNEEIIVKYNK